MDAARPQFEVADVIRLHGDAYLREHPTSLRQRQVLFRLAACRTAQLGGHLNACPNCPDVQVISYNSCRDRHCPKCQGRERSLWVESSLLRILPAPHFHLVFTIPDSLSPLVLRHPRLLYDLLFRASSQTLLDLAADPRHLGVTPGFVSVLHTWAQNLAHHPHIHCIVTPGGLALDGVRWIHSPRRFLLPVKALAKRFRHLFIQGLIHMRASGRLPLSDPYLWASFRHSLYQKRWVVFAKRPFAGPEPLFRYLGNYTHRVAISNHRLLSVGPDSVSFTVRARQPDSGRRKVTLTGLEFLRRFLLHVLPKGFVRIRYFGLYTSAHRATRLASARLLQSPPPPRNPKLSEVFVPPILRCHHCGQPLVRLPLPPAHAPFKTSRSPPYAA